VRRAAVFVVLIAVAVGAAAWRLVDVKPNPNQQAVSDGCRRDTTKIYTGFAPNWVYVNDKDYPATGPPPPPRWAEGIVASRELPALASRVSSSDDPITHRSFDSNVDLKVTAADDFLTGTSRDATPEAGTIHTEREIDAFPAWAWPAPGDYVRMLGSWVWDCDHYQQVGEKTELHPFYGLWSTGDGLPSPRSRTGEAEGDVFFSTDGTPAAAQAICAHQTKGAETFKDCTHSVSEWVSIDGAYDFNLCAAGKAPRGGRLEWRVVDRGSVNAPAVRAAPAKPGCVAVAFTVNAPQGRRVVVAKQVFVGWTKARRLEHLRLRFDSVLIRRAMDPSCAPDQPACPAKNESTLLGQIAQPPGEWQLTWSVAGIWGTWPGTLLARDGSVFKGRQHVDFWLPARLPWTLVMEGRECDFGAIPDFDGVGHALQPCPKTNEVGNSTGDDYGGSLVAHFRSPDASLGRHATNATSTGSSCPPSNVHGCYQLRYTVSRVS
jgi:hypothetical protein